LKRLVIRDERAPSLTLLLHLHRLSFMPCTHLPHRSPRRGHCTSPRPQLLPLLALLSLTSCLAPYSPQLGHCYQLQGLAFRASLAGPRFYLGTAAARGHAVEQCLATPQGRGLLAQEGHLPREGTVLNQSCSDARKSKSFLPAIFFSPFPSLPHCGYFFLVKLFQGTLIFVRTLISFLLDDKHL